MVELKLKIWIWIPFSNLSFYEIKISFPIQQQLAPAKHRREMINEPTFSTGVHFGILFLSLRGVLIKHFYYS